MGKKSRLRRECQAQGTPADAFWTDPDGIHTSFIVPGAPPPNAEQEMTAAFQKKIRNSPMWIQMVKQFGKAKAEELLKQCKAEIKP